MPRRMTSRVARAGLTVLALALAACGRGDREAAPIRVAAAADLTDAFEELGRIFEDETGDSVSFSFGSTGLLAQQLRRGAPFDVFAAANVSFVDDVVAAGVCDASTVAPYARGRIAVWTRRGAVTPPAALSDLRDARLTRVAIASPEHAPYGQAAEQALRAAGLWDALEPRLVVGENVRQAFQFAETGNVEAAIVALALVIQDRDNPWLLVKERLHAPIRQSLVVCAGGARREGGEAFALFVGSESGRAVMRRYGFLLPDEEL
jgi:molybdate transport system substrate-binding protein